MEEQDIKEKILKGTEELFMRYGIRSISMDDIARHLAVSKKTLYQHFADKDELVLMVSRNHLNKNINEFNDIRDSSRNTIEELARLSVCMKVNMESMNPTLLFDLQKFHPTSWAEWLEFKNKHLYDSIVRNITQGIADGYVREDVDPEIMAVIRIELVQTAFNNDVFPPSRFKLARVQEQLFDQFVYGIVTDKGKKLYQKHKNVNPQPLTIL
ncbi:MAG: TetR/AcrR family transcriptional regulator [Cyclobacteriaceae bacterium]|nr:TetR/AcrR family transcriptional regulator [Cyclobacteriaceae bacterium]